MAVDAGIVDLFGPVPAGIDLSEHYAKNADAANIALIAIAFVSVVLRFGARFVQKAGLKADDYFVLAALVRDNITLPPSPFPSFSFSHSPTVDINMCSVLLVSLVVLME